MTSPPLVSVITPTLNRANALSGTLESVHVQSYPQIEHVVVDGGSTDGTLALLADRQQSRSSLHWISEADDGVYDAVNRGLTLASGDILAYLNSDDRYFPWTVDVAVRALTSNPQIGYVYGDMLNVDLARRRGRINFYPSFERDYQRRHGLVAQPTVFWRRDVFEEIGAFDTTFELAADLDYWARAAEVFAAYKVDEVLAWESEHANRLTTVPEGRVTALRELDRLRESYTPRSPVARRLLRLRDASRRALSYRVSAIRFLLASTKRSAHTPGIDWGGFLAGDHGFSVDRGRMSLELLPYIGRRFAHYVTADSARVELPANL